MVRYRRVVLRSFEEVVYSVLHAAVLDVAPVRVVVDRFAEQRAARLHVVRRRRRRLGPAAEPTAALVAAAGARSRVAVGGRRRRRQVEVDAEVRRGRRRGRGRRGPVARAVATTSRQRCRPGRLVRRRRRDVTVVRLNVHRRRVVGDRLTTLNKSTCD